MDKKKTLRPFSIYNRILRNMNRHTQIQRIVHNPHKKSCNQQSVCQMERFTFLEYKILDLIPEFMYTEKILMEGASLRCLTVSMRLVFHLLDKWIILKKKKKKEALHTNSGLESGYGLRQTDCLHIFLWINRYA